MRANNSELGPELIGMTPEDGEFLTQLYRNLTKQAVPPDSPRMYYQLAVNIRRRMAGQLGTPSALRDFRAGLSDLAQIEEELGNAEQAGELRSEAATVSDQLAALSDDPPCPSDHPDADG